MMMVIPTLPASKYMILPVLERQVKTSVLAVRWDAGSVFIHSLLTILTTDCHFSSPWQTGNTYILGCLCYRNNHNKQSLSDCCSCSLTTVLLAIDNHLSSTFIFRFKTVFSSGEAPCRYLVGLFLLFSSNTIGSEFELEAGWVRSCTATGCQK